jgi:hypothetical protein
MAHDGNTFYEVHTPLLSQDDLCAVLGKTADSVNNWIKLGYLKPDGYVLGPRRTPLKRYSIVGTARAVLIASCVDHAGLRLGLAAEIADFCAPIINETFERDAAGEQVSNVVRLVVSQLQPDGRLVSWACYRRPHEYHFYIDDPELNPDAQPVGFPDDAPCIVTPLTAMFSRVFLAAAALLAEQGRGGMDKFRRPISADA